MYFVFMMLLKTAVVPRIVAVAVAWYLSRHECWRSRAGTLGTVAGFVAGWFMQEFAVWLPQRYLDWMPVAALLLAIIPKFAPLPVAFLLVPPFATLQPPRPFAIGLVTCVTYAGGLFVGKTTAKINQRLLILVLMATGTACSVVLVQSFSLKFAQIAGLFTAALVPGIVWKNEPDGSVTGLAMFFYGLMSNLMFIGFANTSSNVPTSCFGLPLLAPVILLWNASGSAKQITRLVVVAALLLLSIIPALLAHPPWEGGV